MTGVQTCALPILPKKEEPVAQALPAQAPVVKEEPKQLELKLDDVKQEATLTVTTSTVEVTPAPEKKKSPPKKRTTKSTSKKKPN